MNRLVIKKGETYYDQFFTKFVGAIDNNPYMDLLLHDASIKISKSQISDLGYGISSNKLRELIKADTRTEQQSGMQTEPYITIEPNPIASDSITALDAMIMITINFYCPLVSLNDRKKYTFTFAIDGNQLLHAKQKRG